MKLSKGHSTKKNHGSKGGGVGLSQSDGTIRPKKMFNVSGFNQGKNKAK